MYRFFLVLLLLVISALPAQSQSNATASIQGAVTDPSGAAVPGATVTLKSNSSEATRTTTTDRQGRYAFSALTPGAFVLSVEGSGFAKASQSAQVDAGQSVDLSLSLEVGALRQSVTVTAEPTSITETSTAQTLTTVDRKDFKDAPNLNISEAFALIPGVTTIAGNGPRDVSVSVRGSNDRQTFGIRNAQVFEDGFPLTQPDGTARTDLTDPHAYSGIDVVQGPSSTLYGNYATGGAIDFHTRAGGDIRGVEFGTDAGSFGFLNNYLTVGSTGDRYQYMLFLSNARARQFTQHTQYNTITANLLATFALRPQDRVTLKFINNDLDTALSIRLSLAQYQTNPYQSGCAAYNAANPNGCASVSLFLNGFNGSKQSFSADQAGLGRHDRRTIAAARWEHDFSDAVTWRTQFVFDNRDINQPTSATSGRGTYPSFNLISDGTRKAFIFGQNAVTYAGGNFNYETISSYNYNVAPGGNATLGGQTQTIFAKHLNTGFRAREELTFAHRWTAVVGLGGEYTKLTALETIYNYPTTGTPIPTTTPVSADRPFFNVAPEAALMYRAKGGLRLHARLGTGYGTPQATNLFITPQGTFGNNTQLKTQKNVGIDVGADWSATPSLQFTVAGFYERFSNELVTQSAGANLQSFTFNAPSSAHRGLLAGIDWRPLPEVLRGLRFRTSYLLDRQIYRTYLETLSAGTQVNTFDRSSNNIPGVVPNDLNARLIYGSTSSRFGSIGGYLEANFRDAFYIDNANLLQAPSSSLLNLDVHYDPSANHGAWSRLHFFFDLQNLANRTYVASASNITDSISSTTGLQNGAGLLTTATGSIYAGSPRASYGGVRIKF